MSKEKQPNREIVPEIVARAVIISGKHILLAKLKSEDYTFLIGGRQNFGNLDPDRREEQGYPRIDYSITHALEREVEEELGTSLVSKDLLGVVEHMYREKGIEVYQINFLFIVKTEVNFVYPAVPDSREEKLELLWAPFEDLRSVNLTPPILSDVIPDWIRSPITSRWVSTIDSDRGGWGGEYS